MKHFLYFLIFFTLSQCSGCGPYIKDIDYRALDVDSIISETDTNGVIFMKKYNNGLVVSIRRLPTIKGKVHGEVIETYRNGIVTANIYFRNGKGLGDAFYYDTLGRLKAYQLYDFEGNFRYYREYNILGQVIDEEGGVIAQMVTYDLNDTIELNDTIRFEAVVPQPPQCRTQVIVADESDSKLYRIDTLMPHRGYITFKRKFDKIGNFNMAVIGEMYDSTANKIYRDTIVKNFFVKGPRK